MAWRRDEVFINLSRKAPRRDPFHLWIHIVVHSLQRANIWFLLDDNGGKGHEKCDSGGNKGLLAVGTGAVVVGGMAVAILIGGSDGAASAHDLTAGGLPAIVGAASSGIAPAAVGIVPSDTPLFSPFTGDVLDSLSLPRTDLPGSRFGLPSLPGTPPAQTAPVTPGTPVSPSPGTPPAPGVPGLSTVPGLSSVPGLPTLPTVPGTGTVVGTVTGAVGGGSDPVTGVVSGVASTSGTGNAPGGVVKSVTSALGGLLP